MIYDLVEKADWLLAQVFSPYVLLADNVPSGYEALLSEAV
jgi:hypothetical protein